jgi:surface polysaccharide O-acyltransferase-like enzyme
MKKRDSLIDILKGLSILAVIFIHFNGKLFPFLSLSQKYWLLSFDQILRFCVPLFVALSGYSLAKRYSSEKINFVSFLRRRIFKIVPAYLFWSAIAYLSIILFKTWPGYQDSYPWWQIIFLGKADYHLYFVPMVVQLYLLFPLLLQAVKKYQVWFLTTACLFQYWWFWFVQQQIKPLTDSFWQDQWQYLFCVSWIGYFVLGIFLALQKEFRKKIFGAIGLGALILGLKLSTSISWQLFNEGKNYIQITRFNRPENFIYASGFILLSICFGHKLMSLPKTILQPFEKLGQWSYGIYLAHNLPLRFITDVRGISPLNHPEIQISFILGGSLVFAWFYKQATKIQSSILKITSND